MSSNLILKNENVIPEISEKAILHLIMLILGKLFYTYKLIRIALKPSILMTSILLAQLLNVNVKLMLIIFFLFDRRGFFKKEKKEACFILTCYIVLLHRVIV